MGHAETYGFGTFVRQSVAVPRVPQRPADNQSIVQQQYAQILLLPRQPGVGFVSPSCFIGDLLVGLQMLGEVRDDGSKLIICRCRNECQRGKVVSKAGQSLVEPSEGRGELGKDEVEVERFDGFGFTILRLDAPRERRASRDAVHARMASLQRNLQPIIDYERPPQPATCTSRLVQVPWAWRRVDGVNVQFQSLTHAQRTTPQVIVEIEIAEVDKTRGEHDNGLNIVYIEDSKELRLAQKVQG